MIKKCCLPSLSISWELNSQPPVVPFERNLSRFRPAKSPFQYFNIIIHKQINTQNISWVEGLVARHLYGVVILTAGSIPARCIGYQAFNSVFDLFLYFFIKNIKIKLTSVTLADLSHIWIKGSVVDGSKNSDHAIFRHNGHFSRRPLCQLS